MKNYIIYVLLIELLTGCYGINKYTSEIDQLNTTCISSNAWEEIIDDYSIKEIKDSIFLDGLADFNLQPFSCDILFFSDNPKELIGIDKDHYSVRYVFNPDLSEGVLDGLSLELSLKEKNRILDRVQKVIIDYQCQTGKEESMKLIEGRE